MRCMGLVDAEMVALVAALPPNALPRLKELALHDNICGDETCDALASLLHRGALPQLASLALPRNARVSAVGRASLKAAASARPGLKLVLP